MSKRSFFATSTMLACAAFSNGAWAQGAGGQATEEEIVVVADPVGLLERAPSSTVFGLGMSLIETPRSATLVSDTTLERYGIEEVDDLITISPGTFTASFYGVRGAVNIRGTLAESYFRGFKRIENRGTYPTPLGATSQVDIVRGPPTPIYGPGKVGGLINIIPRTARANGDNYIDEATGGVEVTVGSYGKFNTSGQIGVPIDLGGEREGGVFAYLEYENSDSYYRGLHPEHILLQLSGEFDITSSLRLSVGGMMYDAEGYVQSPGWNRLTQDLVDHQLYQAGRDATLVDLDGNGRLTRNEVPTSSFVTGYFGFPPTVPAQNSLDTGVQLVRLDPRTIFISDRDFSDTKTNTFYAELTQSFGASSLHLELFYDDLFNQRFVSYGFPAHYDASAYEARLHYDFSLESPGGMFTADNMVGVSYRDQEAKKRESFNSGYIVLDRRDLSFGPTATDIFDDPFSSEGPGVTGLGWDNDVDSEWSDSGVFFVSNIGATKYVNLLLSGRYDWYEASAIDRGAVCFCAANILFEREQDEFSYSASLSFDSQFGLHPYFTYADTAALEIGQAGDLAPSLLANGQWISDSTLKEGGLKFELLGGTLVGSLAGYEQTRTRLSQMNSVIATTAKGVEFETRWLATDNLSFTIAANTQETTVEGPDASFIYVPAPATGLTGPQGYGGSFAVYNYAASPLGFDGDYELRTVPQTVASIFGSYVSDEYEWGRAGVTLGVTSVSETAGKLVNPVVFPSYELVNASAFYALNGFEVTINVDNVFDELYFQPVADVYSDMAVLPGRGREWRLTVKKTF